MNIAKKVIYCLYLLVPNGTVPAKSYFELQLDLIDFSETSFVIKLGNSVGNQTPYILSLKNSNTFSLYKAVKGVEKQTLEFIGWYNKVLQILEEQLHNF